MKRIWIRVRVAKMKRIRIRNTGWNPNIEVIIKNDVDDDDDSEHWNQVVVDTINLKTNSLMQLDRSTCCMTAYFKSQHQMDMELSGITILRGSNIVIIFLLVKTDHVTAVTKEIEYNKGSRKTKYFF